LAAITWLPADDFGQQELLSIRVGGEGIIFNFYPGVAKDVPQDEFAPATVAALLRAVHGNMTTPGAPTVTAQGTTGAATWGYKIAAIGKAGDTLLSAQGQDTNGNATLTAGNNNLITRPALPAHSAGWRVIRTQSGGTPSSVNVDISGVIPATTTTFTDTGIAGTAYTPVGSNPSVDLVLVGLPADL